MKKEFVKLSKRLLSVLLAVIMLASVGGNFAFAASSGPNTAAPSTDVGEEVKVVTGMVSSAVFFSTGKVYTLDTNYWTTGSDPQYDHFYGTVVATFKLSNYAKISRLMSILYPADQIPYELGLMTEYNQLSSLKRKIFSGQTRTIWSYLSSTTQRQIANMDAEHALKHIRRKPEYSKNADLRKYVDTHLEQTLSCRRLRTGLSTIFPAYSYAISQWNVQALLNFARCVIDTPQYRQLYWAMIEISNDNHDMQSLIQRFSYSEAKTKELGLSLAADYYLHDQVYVIETMQIVLPATLLTHNVDVVDAVDSVDPGDHVATPIIPVAEARTPKYYR